MDLQRFANIRNLTLCVLLLTALSSTRASDVINTASVSFDGVNGPVTLPTNLVRTVVIDPVPVGGTLFVQKTASRDFAEIGEYVDFTVTIKNASTVPLQGVVVEDQLPFGFRLETDSPRIGTARIVDPGGGTGPNLSFPIGVIDPSRTITLTYRTRVGVDAFHGDGINRAAAHTSTQPPALSNVASVRVHLRAGVFTNRSVIIGKVFVDVNHNRIQDDGEPGVPGVRLYIEDGSYVITDAEGKYSFYGLAPRTHVVKLDQTTLPPDAELEPLNNRNANDGGSAFADVGSAELRKVNFAISNATDSVMNYVAKMRAAADVNANKNAEIVTTTKGNLDRNGAPTLAADPRSLPSSGLIFPGVSVQPTTQDRTQSADSFVLGGTRGNLAVAPANNSMRGFSSVPVKGSPPTINTTDDAARMQLATLPSVTLEQAMATDAAGSPFGFVDLKDGDTLPTKQTTVRAKGVVGGKISLRVNGREIPETRIGKRVTRAEENVEAVEYIGIELSPGENKLELIQLDQFGNARGTKTITVIAPDKLGTIRIKTPDNAVADGKTPARVVVELVDAKGVPVTARTAITLDATLGKWLATDLNPREPGVQVFIEGGHAEFLLGAPVEPGDSRIRVASGVLRADGIVSFLPELRPMIAAGLIEGAVNVRHLHASALQPVNSRDSFDSELRELSVHGAHSSAAARSAFYLKGKILGSYLLTASYDSEKDTRDRLFRDIQPDEFYPIYGDSSIKGFEAQSSGRLYVRIDNKKSYLLYGDFITQAPNDLQQLGNYNRSLNGVREHYENKNVSVNAWASYDRTRQVVEEISANGTSGPYAFHSATGLLNSEKIEVLTRDRNNSGLVIRTVEMTRFSDYEFEPLTGQILFKAPIPSLDADLNPVSIRVTYEVDQGGNRFWVYGGDAQVKLNDRMQIGGAFARDENRADRYSIYSGNAVFDLGMKTFLLGEFAHSEDAIEGDGNAGRIELRHNSEKLFARVFWGRADSHFKNQTAILTSGRTEGGAQISYQISKRLRTIFQAVDTESETGGTRRGALVGIEQTLGRDVRVEIDGRYSTETSAPASASTAQTPGTTPNEVHSLRAKLTLPMPWTEGTGRVFGEYEQDIFDSDKRLAAIGGEYQVDAKTRLYLRHEFISSLGGPFELNTVQRQNTTVIGVESAYAKDASLFNEYRARDGFTGREAEAAIGLRNAWTIAEGVRVNTSFERVAPVEGSTTTNDSTAITGAIEYTADPNWKGTARLELRKSDSVDSLMNTLGLAFKLSDNWTALGKSVIYLAQNKGPSAIDQTQARVQAGFAWRQTTADVWNALGKYEFRTENGAPGTFDGGTATSLNANVQRRVNILSLDLNYQPTADLQMSAHYAGKLAYDESGGRNDLTSAHFIAAHFAHDLTKRLDVGLGVNALIAGDGRSAQWGFGPEIGFTLTDNLRAGFGYNINGFNDRDLTQEQYTSRGFYLALRLKFDEQLFGRRKQKSLGEPESKTLYDNK